jgi:hypothetical protein
MTDESNTAETLPGLELVAPGQAPTAMRAAVVATIEALKADGLLEPRHAALLQLALEGADTVAMARRVGRPSGAAQAQAELRATLLALPAPAAGDDAQRFHEFVEKLLAADTGT